MRISSAWLQKCLARKKAATLYEEPGFVIVGGTPYQQAAFSKALQAI